MGITNFIDRAKEPIRKLRKHDKFSLAEYRKEFINFILFVCVASVITYYSSNWLISKFLFKYNNIVEFKNIVEPIKILVSILTGIIVSSFYLPYYIYFTNKEAFTYFVRLRGDNLNPNFRGIVLSYYRKHINKQLMSLATLTNHGEIKADYSTQYQFARMFSETAENYFWATSFDKPSEFPIRNMGYLQKFDGMNLIGNTDMKIPKKARIFITIYRDLVRDIVGIKTYLLQLLKMHMHYHEKEVICSVKFLLCKEEHYQEVIDIVQTEIADVSNFVFDFFIIDDKLIYGRKNKKLNNSNDELNISFVSNQVNSNADSNDNIEVYKKIYQKLYSNSYDIRGLTQLLKDKPHSIKSSIENLASAQLVSINKIEDNIHRFISDSNDYYENIENTELTNSRYGKYFENSKLGATFFNAWVDLIRDCQRKWRSLLIALQERRVMNFIMFGIAKRTSTRSIDFFLMQV